MKRVNCKKNYIFAKSLERLLLKEKESDGVIDLAVFVATWLANNLSTIFFSEILENVIGEISQRKLINYKPITDDKKAKQLIVLTEAYSFGGHTRIAEHIIQKSSSCQFDVYVTLQKSTFPESLKQLAKTQKAKVFFGKNSAELIDIAKDLQVIASYYQSLTLLTHPEDIIPNLAFSNSKWNVPIFLYNHADHRFWIGTTIADAVFNMSKRSSGFSNKYRGVKNNYELPIPIKTVPQLDAENSKILRGQLGIPSDSFVILSAGPTEKYLPTKNINFIKIAQDILSTTTNNVVFVIVGPTVDNLNWKRYVDDSKGKIIVKEMLPYNKFIDYYGIANLYLDSFPISGFTSLLQAVSFDLPIVFIDQGEFFPDTLLPFSTTYKNITKKILRYIKLENINSEKPDISSHEITNFIHSYEKVLSEHLIHNPEHLSVDNNSFNLDLYTKNLFSNSPYVHDHHLYILLLNLPISLRLKISLLFLKNGQFFIAAILFSCNLRRYKWIKNLIKR